MTTDPLRVHVGTIFEREEDVTPSEAGGILAAVVTQAAPDKGLPVNEVEIDVSECDPALFTEAFFQTFLTVVQERLPEQLENARSTRWVFPKGYDEGSVERWLSSYRPPSKELDS